MSLVDRHHEDERAGVISSHGFNDKISHKGLYKPANIWFDGPRFIVKDLFLKCDTPHIFMTYTTIMMISILGVICLDYTGIVPLPRLLSPETFIQRYYQGTAMIGVYIISFLLGIKYLARARYLVFEDGWVYLHTKTKGVWGYPVSQLKFHLIRGPSVICPTYLEIELPEPSFKDDEKMVVLEIASRREAIDGNLAVLLSLIQGDKAPYEGAVNRRYMCIPPEEKQNWFYDHFNFTNHIFTWFLVYRYNQFIFWLVHGSQKKIARRLRESSEQKSAP